VSFAASVTSQSSRKIGPSDPMPFGKHKGIPIDQVPPDYLCWALKHADITNSWPEFRTTIESLVGPVPFQGSAPNRNGGGNGSVMSLQGLCAVLRANRVRLSTKDGQLVADGADGLTQQARDALATHENALANLVACVEPPRGGSAKLTWAADLRCRVKGWYGRLSRQFHPDAGGSAPAQAAINRAYQELNTVLSEWEVS
jgi:hypothetical protein